MDVMMLLAWMLWETVRKRDKFVVVLAWMSTQTRYAAKHGGTNDFEALESPEMPRRPVQICCAISLVRALNRKVVNPSLPAGALPAGPRRGRCQRRKERQQGFPSPKQGLVVTFGEPEYLRMLWCLPVFGIHTKEQRLRSGLSGQWPMVILQGKQLVIMRGFCRIL